MTIVEVGPSYFSILSLSEVTRNKVKTGAVYIGIDLNQEDLLELRKREVRRSGGKICPLVGDLGAIPLQDNTADEVWIVNVLGGTLVNKPIVLPNNTKKYELGWGRYFTELSRILKPNGELFIGEWAPRIRDTKWLMDENYNDFGLSKHNYEGRALEDFTGQYGISLDVISGWDRRNPPFFIALTKSASPCLATRL